MPQSIVPFYEYTCMGDPYTNTTCKVLSRVDDVYTNTMFGPSFIVKFDDGMLKAVAGSQISPWFPV